MIAVRTIFLFLFIVGYGFSSYAQVTIWSEDFNAAADQNVGAIGPTGPPTAPASGKWTITADYTTGLTVNTDWCKVTTFQMEARDVDVTCVWASEVINISAYTNVQFSMVLKETGTHEDADSIRVYYKLDGGGAVFAGAANGDFTTSNHSTTGLNGTTLELFVRMKNNAGTEYLRFDDVLVEGTPSAPCSEPTTAASAITFSNVASSSFDINWTNGNGANRLVVVSTSPLTAAEEPVDGTTYTADATFGSGTAIGSGYVVYDGSGSTVTVTGTAASTTYYVAVFEYDCIPTDYKTDSYPTNSQATPACSEPSVAASNIVFSNIASNGFDINWTSGTGLSRVIVISASPLTGAEEPIDGTTYTGNSTYGSGDAIGSGYVVYNGIGTSTSITGLSSGTTYYVGIFEADCAPTDFMTSSYGSDNETTLAVTATELQFTSYPFSGCREDGDPFQCTVCATDASGNIDASYVGSITISKNSGPGTLSGTTTLAATNGCANFTGLSFNVAGSYIMDATDGTWNVTTVNSIEVYSSCAANSNWEGIIINEFSNGYSGTKEYMEFVVIGECGKTVDITGWIFDDQNGTFTNALNSSSGVASGHYRFANVAQWTAVPVGSLILVYNGDEKNGSITVSDDATDSNTDSVYVIPHNSTALATTTTGVVSLKPIAGASWDSSYTPVQYVSPPTTWTTIGLRNGGDVAQVRSPDGSYFHGCSYGGSGNNMNGGPDNLEILSGSGYRKVFFFNSGNYRDVSNWSSASISGEPDADETPGLPNSAANSQWIRDIKDAAASPCILSVDLIGFRAIPVNEQVELFWSTATESKNSQFIVQRSTNAQSFEDLKTIPGRGNEANGSTYETFDLFPYHGVSYYRLKIVDKAGKEDFSKIVEVEFKSGEGISINRIWPVPANNSLNIEFTLSSAQTIQLEVLNLLGQTVLSRNIDAVGNHKLNLDVSQLAQGTYFLRLSSQSNTISERIIIK